MTQIKNLKDANGTNIFPRTHTKAVIDDNGNSIEQILSNQTDLINQKQLEIGAVQSDNTPTQNSQHWVTSGGVYDAIAAAAEDVSDVSIDGTSSFEKGKIDDSGSNATDAETYYVRTPSASAIPIADGQEMKLQFVYKNSTGATISSVTTRIYKYNNGVFVSYTGTSSTLATITCNGTFNQLRIRGYKNNLGDNYSYCSVTYHVDKTIQDVAIKVDENTADVASIKNTLQTISTIVTNTESQTINKTIYQYADLNSNHYVLDNPYVTSGDVTTNYRGLKVQLKRGDHIVLYTTTTSGLNGWALCDDYRKVLARSGKGLSNLTTPIERNITYDCWLYANINATGSGAADKVKQFKLIVTSNVKLRLEALFSDLNILTKRTPQFCNNPYPFRGSTLKVLSLGNSFAQDSSWYLNSFMDAAGLDKSKFCYYFTFKSGATLEQYAVDYVAGTSYSCIQADLPGDQHFSLIPRAGTYSMPNSSGSLSEIVKQDWDIILLQQASTDAYDWTTYQPYITRLVSLIKRDCPKACIGFMLTWSTTYTGTTHAPSYSQRFTMNANCAKKVFNEVGIDFIVPVGTALQNVRNTILEDSDHLLRDGRHLNFGIGAYVANCAFFEAIIAPFYGVSVVGNSYTTSAGTPVTAENRALCQRCGHAAVANIWEATIFTAFFKDGDTVISSTSSTRGNSVQIPANPTKEGYTFVGWSKDGITTVTPASTIGTANVTYTALWEEVGD